MPYGVTAAQGVLDGGSPPRNSDPKSSSSFKVPGFGSGSGGSSGSGSGGSSSTSSSSSSSKTSHFRGDARATSTTFTGVMQALLKPSRGSAAAAAAAKPDSPERPQHTFRPRSALDLSGHSFSKTMKAEINRSKIAKANGAHGGSGGGGAGGIPRHDWWDRNGGLGMDDSLARPSSGRTVASYAADPARATHLRVPPRAPVAAGSGGSAIQHQQRHRLQQQQQQQQQMQQQSRPMCRPRSHGDAILDELSRAVGLQ